MTTKKTRYAEWIRLDDLGILHVDIELSDCATVLPFLRSCDLEFDCTELERRGEELTFRRGTTIGQVHAALVRFDELNSSSHEPSSPWPVRFNGQASARKGPANE